MTKCKGMRYDKMRMKWNGNVIKCSVMKWMCKQNENCKWMEM